MKSIYLERAIEIIFDSLKDIISENDYSMVSARKSEGEKMTQTIFKTFEAEKLSRVALEEYTVNSKAYGVVLNIYPNIQYNIPIFTFQLGGQIPDKVIFVVDVIHTLDSGQLSRPKELFLKFSTNMEQLGSSKDWINEICTEHALICQYKPMSPDLVLNALSDYLDYWKTCYYQAINPVTDASELDRITDRIIKFKTILHANDAGLEIYLSKFGRKALAAIEEAAFGAEPSILSHENKAENEPVLPQAISGVVPSSEFIWTQDAEAYLKEAPRFVRSKIKKNAEEKAKQLGVSQIDRDFIDKLRK